MEQERKRNVTYKDVNHYHYIADLQTSQVLGSTTATIDECDIAENEGLHYVLTSHNVHCGFTVDELGVPQLLTEFVVVHYHS